MANPIPQTCADLNRRLQKNHRRYGKRLRAAGIDAYRAYDRDIPEIPLSIDRYGAWLRLTAFEPRRPVPDFSARVTAWTQVAAEALDVDVGRCVVRYRRRRRTEDATPPRARRGQRLVVREGPLRFLVNLHDFVDTGLFLDHRPLRKMIHGSATGATVLNLFCYTGALSVAALCGGARHCTSVDLSRNTLRWAEDNLRENDVDLQRSTTVADDVRHFLRQDQGRYDLILLDPPTHSLSDRAAEHDVQRDHPWLIAQCRARLRKTGVLYFSTNARTFSLDSALQDAGTEITAQTIGVDFAPGIHRCWRFGP